MKLVINITIYILFISIYFFDGFLGDGLVNRGLHLIPGRLSWACEILSCIITVYFCILLAIRKKIAVSNVYIFFFIIFFLFLLTGIILNTVPSGAIFAGIRRYFIFMPLFFLPTVYDFSESEIRNHLKVLLVLGFIQIPFAVYQRFFIFKFIKTGDMVTGTLLSSTVLTLNQIFCIAILAAVYIKKQISLKFFLFAVFLLFLPTVINETKATIIMLPIAIAVPILFSSGKVLNFKKVLLISTFVMLAMAIFLPLYSYLYKTDVVSFFDFTSEDKGTRTIRGYLYKGLTVETIEEEPGRIDSLLFPFKILYKDPFRLLFGLGIGNVNSSGIGSFKGEYTEYNKYGSSAISAASMIWETGLIGFFLYLIFLGIILIDGFKLRLVNNLFGAIALGWVSVIIILYLCLFYANIFHIKAVGYLFYYASGLIAAKRANVSGFNEDSG